MIWALVKVMTWGLVRVPPVWAMIHQLCFGFSADSTPRMHLLAGTGLTWLCKAAISAGTCELLGHRRSSWDPGWCFHAEIQRVGSGMGRWDGRTLRISIFAAICGSKLVSRPAMSQCRRISLACVDVDTSSVQRATQEGDQDVQTKR